MCFDDIAGGGLDGFGGGEGTGAAAAGPAFRIVAIGAVQMPAGVGFQVAQDVFGRGGCGDDGVDVVGADMGGEEEPAAVVAGLLDGFEDEAAMGFVEGDGRGLEAGLVGSVQMRAWVQSWLAGFVFVAVDGASGVAAEVGSVGGEGEEVGHRGDFTLSLGVLIGAPGLRRGLEGGWGQEEELDEAGGVLVAGFDGGFFGLFAAAEGGVLGAAGDH